MSNVNGECPCCQKELGYSFNEALVDVFGSIFGTSESTCPHCQSKLIVSVKVEKKYTLELVEPIPEKQTIQESE